MMKRKSVKVAVVILFALGLSIGIGYSFSGGPPPGRTGVPEGGGFPAELTCDVGCHVSFPLNPDTIGQIELIGVPDNYIPGQRYSLTFSISYSIPDRIRWGFQTTAVAMETYLGAGTFVVTDPRRTQVKLGGAEYANRQYMEHRRSGSGPTGQRGSWWEFDWVAPAANVGDVAFFGSGNAAGNPAGNNTGDKIYNPTPDPMALTKGQYIFIDIAAEAEVAAGGGRSVAVGDYDQDGRDDLLLLAADEVLLFRNNGDGTFAEVAASAGIGESEVPGRAAVWGDYDGDGAQDLYLVTAGADVLYRNNGDRTLSDVTGEAGIGGAAPGRAAVWADVNGDELLDLYVANEGQDVLYLNNGDGRFSPVDSAAAGLAEEADSWSVDVADYDGDGWLDIFVANDGQDALYRNNGDGTFRQVATMVGIQTGNVLGLAAAWADYDNDDDPDLFIANMGADLLYRNNGDGTFAEVTAMAGIVQTAVGASAAWADYDRDGDLDLFVATEEQDLLYRNNGDGTFNEVATHSGMTDMAVAGGAAWLDVDEDGNPDVFVANAGGNNLLYLNPGRSGPAPANIVQ